MTLAVQYAALSDIGLHRQGNEDSYVAAPPLFVVCDGMGGAEAGEVASALAVETLVARLEAGDALLEAAHAANAAVYARAGERHEESGMGTTLTAVVVEDRRGRFVHVGDSRAYRLRDGRLDLLSEDHSLVGEMVREGRLTWDEAAVHPHRSILSRALGTEAAVQVDAFAIDLLPGDVLLLCSDGLSSEVSGDVLRDQLTAEDPAVAARGLVDAALAAGGHDNITAVVIRLEAGDEAEPADAEVDLADVEATTQTLVAPGDADTSATSGDASAAAPDVADRPVNAVEAVAARPSRRRLVLLVAVLALVALIGVAGVVVINTCYFVGVEDGDLAVYSGLPWSLGPLELNSVYLKSARPYGLLDTAQRELVDARRVHTKDGALRLAEDLGMLP